MKLALALALLMAASAAHAQITKLLIPLNYAEPVPGANGSLWATEAIARNVSADTEVRLYWGFSDCPINICWRLVRPGETIALPPASSDATGGQFQFLDSSGLDNLKVNLRIRDISTGAISAGTELPTIRDADALTSTAYLLNIPVASGYRTSLRVYGFALVGVAAYQVRVFPLATADVLKELVVIPVPPDGDNDFGIQAPVAEIHDMTAGLEGLGPVRFEVTPLTPGARFWAFASVTNDTTQFVTVVTPSR